MFERKRSLRVGGKLSLTRSEGQTVRRRESDSGRSACPLLCAAPGTSRAQGIKPCPRTSTGNTNSGVLKFSLYVHKLLPQREQPLEAPELICFRYDASRCCHDPERLQSPVPPPMAERTRASGKCSLRTCSSRMIVR